MNVPEFVAKELLREAGIRTPQGSIARDGESAADIARKLGGRVAIKAQVPAGGRGKSGGIAFAGSPEAAREKAAELIGMAIAGHRVASVLVETAADIEHELYVAILNDGATRAPLVLFSNDGGVDIEQQSGKIVRRAIDVRSGLSAETAFEITGDAQIAAVLQRMYERFIALDCELLEINPLARDRTGAVVALDCKMTIDDSSRPRQQALFERVAAVAGPQGMPIEQRARDAGLYYIELDGEIGILANGAGLTMTTLDAVAMRGGRPANFLEIG
ncbi:MAG: acetate--CoA ligase family protein, partial [Candidatus Eremiobacteraeota bacterium]|nr:acetate--CoA ligase family protein [Candidatus Eremiobacteraeota bacterium]